MTEEFTKLANKKEKELSPNASFLERVIFSLDADNLRPELRILLQLFKTEDLPPKVSNLLRLTENTLEMMLCQKFPNIDIDEAKDFLLAKDQEKLVEMLINCFKQFVGDKMF
eukprot:UN28341